jgi:hypothetical protein
MRNLSEIRQITHFNRHQVTRMLLELRSENGEISATGHGAGARYYWREKPNDK